MFFCALVFSAYGKTSAKLVGFLNTFFTFLFLFAVKNADFHFISFPGDMRQTKKSLLLCLIKSGIFWGNKFKQFLLSTVCRFLEDKKRTYLKNTPFSSNIYLIFFLVGRLIIFLFVL